MAKDRLIGEDYCPNCRALLAEQAWYCSQCGQKCTDGRISIKELLNEFFEAIFNIDSRFLLSIRAMFFPGKLTNQYFLGKRKSYVHPLRLFLVNGIIFFTLVSLVTSKYADRNLAKASDAIFKDDAYRLQVIEQLDTLRGPIIEASSEPVAVRRAFDSLFAKVNAAEDSFTIAYFEYLGDWQLVQKELELSKVDALNLNEQELAKKYEVESYVGRTTLQQSLKIITQLDQVVSSAIGQLIWSFLLMMTMLGFVLKLLYIRRGLYYVEHLVFSFHFHAFAFFISSFFLLLAFISPSLFEAHLEKFNFIFILGFLYMFLAMKKVYKQSWGKTFVKFTLLNFGYLFVFAVAIAFSLIVSYILF